MSAMLNSIKADLLGRRLRPLLALLGVAFVAAVAYAVLGGGSSAPAKLAAVPAPVAVGAPPTATTAPANPHAAVSETTSGASYQRQGGAHNPFIPLPVPKTAASAAVKTSQSSSASGGSTASGTTQGATKTVPSSGGAAPTTPKPAPKPKQPQAVYQVAILFGPVPPAGQNPQLTPYEDIKRLTPLPSQSNPLVVFAGVSSSGKGAVFTLVGEAIVNGTGTCLPNASQCQSIEIAPGKSEELSAIEANGQSVAYELQVVSISKLKATTARAARLNARFSSAGRALLRRAGLEGQAELRYSPAKGVVVLGSHQGF